MFAVEFRQPVESVRYDFARSTANMTGGEGTSADKRLFHWLGNQIMDDGGWVVFVIKSNTPPSIKRLCTKLLGRSSDMRMLFPPDPVGLQELATAIKAG